MTYFAVYLALLRKLVAAFIGKLAAFFGKLAVILRYTTNNNNQ